MSSVFYDKISFIWTVLYVWCYFDENIKHEVLHKCQRYVKGLPMWKVCTSKHTHTHTSTIVGKEFYWFGFYIVYAFCTWQTIAKRRVASQFTKLLLLWLLRLLLLLSNENICKMPITWWVMMGSVPHRFIYICEHVLFFYTFVHLKQCQWNFKGNNQTRIGCGSNDSNGNSGGVDGGTHLCEKQNK